MLSFFKTLSARELEALKDAFAVARFQPDGTIIDANSNFLALVGSTLEELKGKKHSILVPRDSNDYLESEKLWQALKEGGHVTSQFKRMRGDGTAFWLDGSYVPFRNGAGETFQIVLYASDATERNAKFNDLVGQVDAINKSQAVIQFALDGTILSANNNFLGALGYGIEEIKGKHHSMFVEHATAQSEEYKQFWQKLRNGEFVAGQFQRVAKGGKEIWIEASYNPIFDSSGKPCKVVKYATDITEQKQRGFDLAGQIEAIGKSQAVIQFDLDGTILSANTNFLHALGYELDGVKGRHHRMFVDPEYASSDDYRRFWSELAAGRYQAGEYKRFGRGGKEVWILASYNPILDANGRPFKVVKYAADITKQMQARISAEQLVSSADTNAQSVAAAVEEMTASIGEISRSMTRSQEAVNGIVNKSMQADAASVQLKSSSIAMEGVVDLIRNIAGQVNLLALNATIEAARAGEAGKGFAVVAAEVKNLATQTTKATDEIAQEIQSMQVVSINVGSVVAEISDATRHVSEYVSNVASAIEEQSAVTKEISANMHTMSRSVAEINECVKTISSSGA